jgi:cytochrome c553
MSGDRIASLRNPWFTASVGITAAIAIIASIAGFVWLPLQQGERFKGVWDAICSAAGLVWTAPSGAQIVRADYPTTRVRLFRRCQGRARDRSDAAQRWLSRCTMCHGAARAKPAAQSRRAAPDRDLSSCRLRQAHQRGHGPAHGRSQ